MKSLRTIATFFLLGAALVGSVHAGTVVRDHRGQDSDSNQVKPPKDTGWGNGSGTVRDHRKPLKLPCPVRLGLPAQPGC